MSAVTAAAPAVRGWMSTAVIGGRQVIREGPSTYAASSTSSGTRRPASCRCCRATRAAPSGTAMTASGRALSTFTHALREILGGVCQRNVHHGDVSARDVRAFMDVLTERCLRPGREHGDRARAYVDDMLKQFAHSCYVVRLDHADRLGLRRKIAFAGNQGNRDRAQGLQDRVVRGRVGDDQPVEVQCPELSRVVPCRNEGERATVAKCYLGCTSGALHVVLEPHRAVGDVSPIDPDLPSLRLRAAAYELVSLLATRHAGGGGSA
jgi:hypothetical protein